MSSPKEQRDLILAPVDDPRLKEMGVTQDYSDLANLGPEAQDRAVRRAMLDRIDKVMMQINRLSWQERQILALALQGEDIRDLILSKD